MPQEGTEPINRIVRYSIYSTVALLREAKRKLSLRDASMANGFIKLNRSELTIDLLQLGHDAFILLTIIALRARRTNDPNLRNLKVGQTLIGDYESYGMTERRYRTSKDKLEKLNLATFQATNKGTIATLTDTSVYDLNIDDDRRTDRQTRDEQETNKNSEISPLCSPILGEPPSSSPPYISPSLSPSRKKESNSCTTQRKTARRADPLTFDFESNNWKGITDEDKASWSLAYPSIDVTRELAKACEWVKGSPEKVKNRKLWRKFLMTWFSRADEQASRLAPNRSLKGAGRSFATYSRDDELARMAAEVEGRVIS